MNNAGTDAIDGSNSSGLGNHVRRHVILGDFRGDPNMCDTQSANSAPTVATEAEAERLVALDPSLVTKLKAECSRAFRTAFEEAT
jgi:hypothetical protein